MGRRRDRDRDRDYDRRDRDRDYDRRDYDRRERESLRRKGPQSEDICYNCGKSGHW